MSKSTNKYGEVKFRANASPDGSPRPSRKLLAQFKKMDELATKEFGMKYDKLTGQQKSALHFNLNTGKYNEAQNVQKATA